MCVRCKRKYTELPQEVTSTQTIAKFDAYFDFSTNNPGFPFVAINIPILGASDTCPDLLKTGK
jgi:hypothetical protein